VNFLRGIVRHISFLALTLTMLAGHAAAQAPKSSSETQLTAQEVIDRIKAHVGVPWQADTVDTFKAGNPTTPVTGIAVTMMATMDVLQRAVAAGDNLIITHEPTFYGHLDKADNLHLGEKDPVLAEKRAYIEKHHLVIWRFHDFWHMRRPDGIEAGLIKTLGWEQYQDRVAPFLFSIPATTVGELAEFLKSKLAIGNIRVVGKRDMRVSRVALSPGAAGSEREIEALELPGIQVLILGETREWETVEYVADAISEGKQIALIVLSHVPSEQAGMEECTSWLKGFVKEVPVQFVAAPDPFAAGTTLTR
jgi:putative NIF3 family GTP cyclohydrolase 1 type 2